jgi:hypothetical protein
MATGAGTHLAVSEVFGAEDSEMLVASVNIRDTRCCDECESWSRHPDGSLKLYRLSDIKPVGYNMTRKRRDWHLTAATQHPSCRCVTVYIPKGWTVDMSGNLRKLRPEETVKIEKSSGLP